MQHILLVFLSCWVITALGGCIYHPPIQQGNIFTNKELTTLYKGMTKDQAQTILGNSVLTDIFFNNRKMIYVCAFQQSHCRRIQSTSLIVKLHNNHIIDFRVYKHATVS